MPTVQRAVIRAENTTLELQAVAMETVLPGVRQYLVPTVTHPSQTAVSPVLD